MEEPLKTIPLPNTFWMWRRVFAFMAFTHFVYYTLRIKGDSEIIIWADVVIILSWMIPALLEDIVKIIAEKWGKR
tara:strand:+ start:589 stop:813 length:225 start_codon:yes stop_codon:yes gene_type:complete